MSLRKKNPLLIPCTVLIALSVISFVIYFYYYCKDWLRNITANLGTGLIVAVLTALLIDNIIRTNHEKERKKYQSVALQQLETPLVHQLYLLFYIFKASVEIKPQKKYENVHDLFDNDFFHHLVFFDFSKKAPIYGPVFGGTQWFDYISHDCKEFVDALNRTLSKYSVYLDSEIVEIMEHTINSFFVKWVLDAPVMREIAKNEGFKQGSWNLFAAPSVLESVHEYTGLFTKLVEHYNGLVTEEKKILIRKTDDDLWRNDFIPIGSGRITQKII
jgi:hypothetical protein